MAKKDNKVIMARNTIIGFVTMLAIFVFAFVGYISSDVSEGEIVANEDYSIVENALPRRPGDPIEVVEFFSYACVHCKTFDSVIEEWAADQADDVEFRRMPATFSPIWALLSQSYLTFESAGVLDQNHTRMFRAIHDTGRQFLTPEMVADYADGKGISKEEFMSTFNSSTVRDAMRKVDRAQRRYQIAATPSLVVAGKYVISMQGGQRRALFIADKLVAQERAGNTTSSSPQ